MMQRTISGVHMVWTKTMVFGSQSTLHRKVQHSGYLEQLAYTSLPCELAYTSLSFTPFVPLRTTAGCPTSRRQPRSVVRPRGHVPRGVGWTIPRREGARRGERSDATNGHRDARSERSDATRYYYRGSWPYYVRSDRTRWTC